jgi:hypothetical protein
MAVLARSTAGILQVGGLDEAVLDQELKGKIFVGGHSFFSGTSYAAKVVYVTIAAK